jgi:two-component system, response regulator PdtaR
MRTILIVEDELILAMINQYIVESLGYQVIDVVTSGEAAIDSVKKNNPDLILMDIMIEGFLDGIEAMYEIRKFCNAPVIYITGNSDPKAVQKAQCTKYSALLTKPVDKDSLKEILDTLK